MGSEKRMMKLFKKILLSTFAIGASVFIGNNVFAENYRVNIAVLGDKQNGKTQVVRRIFGHSFQEMPKPSDWTYGACGRIKQYRIGGDVFECKYYDAPGYLEKADASLDQQIESKAIKDANIALIVVDPQQKGCMQRRFTSSLQEAFVRHVDHVFAVNPDCKVIVVANKKDMVTNPKKLDEYMYLIGCLRHIHGYDDDDDDDGLRADSILVSAKTGEGIPELEKKIVGLLGIADKTKLSVFSDEFRDCACGHTQCKDKCVKGYRGDFYCTEACLRSAEAEPCSRSDCTSKDKFLRVRTEGFVDPKTNKMYCSHRCYQLDVGEPCGCCSCRCNERYLRDEHQGFVSRHTDRMYCDQICYKRAEGTVCDNKDCYERFVVEDGRDGLDFFTNKKTGKKYCPKHSSDANSGCTFL
mgnify:FL=1